VGGGSTRTEPVISALRGSLNEGVLDASLPMNEKEHSTVLLPGGMVHSAKMSDVGGDALDLFWPVRADYAERAAKQSALYEQVLAPDAKHLYVAVGSSSNIADNGMEVEEGRAAIYELDLASGASRIFAGGLRNAVGMAWEPTTGVLWTVVNERDGLGDETPPDYLTSVRDGGFYGWPYCYWGQTVDDRVPQDTAMVAKAITPDYALGGHTASLGLCWVPAGTLPGFPDGMAIGQHGSWNRSTLSGYKLVFVPFENGRPSGPARDILSGFLAPDEKESYGRPVGVVVGPDGRSLLMADDVGDVIWRVTGA